MMMLRPKFSTLVCQGYICMYVCTFGWEPPPQHLNRALNHCQIGFCITTYNVSRSELFITSQSFGSYKVNAMGLEICMYCTSTYLHSERVTCPNPLGENFLPLSQRNVLLLFSAQPQQKLFWCIGENRALNYNKTQPRGPKKKKPPSPPARGCHLINSHKALDWTGHCYLGVGVDSVSFFEWE